MELSLKLRKLYYSLFKIKKNLNKSQNLLSIYILNGLVRSYGVSFDSHENIFIPDMPANNIVKLNNEFNIIDVYDIKKDKLVNCSYIGKTNKKKQ